MLNKTDISKLPLDNHLKFIICSAPGAGHSDSNCDSRPIIKTPVKQTPNFIDI